MIAATRRWLRRNRTNIGIGIGVLGAGYLAGQYVISKIREARERLTSDRIAKENLRRRFQQNQEDCTFTVLALLPTVTENILDELPVENLTNELQQQRAEKLGRSTASSDNLSPSDLSSTTSPPKPEGDSRSVTSSQAEGFLHTSQMAASATSEAEPGATLKTKKPKAQLWNELKLSSITRAFTMIYTLSFLTLLTRIQLNLLGRRNYLFSVASMAAQASRDSTINLENHEDEQNQDKLINDLELNRKFLTFSWWLLHRGWRDIMSEVETAVKEVFGNISPREEITFGRMSSLVVATRKIIEGQTEEERRSRKWLQYILPPQDQEDLVLQESGVLIDSGHFPPANPAATPPEPTASTSSISDPMLSSTSSDPLLRRLLDETSDLIDSPTATHITTLLLDALFSQLTDAALSQQAFKIPSSAPPTMQDPLGLDRVQEIPDDATGEPSEAKARLATVLAVVTRQAHAIGNGVPNEYVQALEEVKQLEAFAAVVYSSNFDVRDVEVPEEVAEAEAKEEAKREETTPASAGGMWGMFENVWGRTLGGR